MSDLPAFPGFPSPPSPPPPPSGGGSSGIPPLPFLDTPPSQATDSNGAANTVVEGAAVNTLVGITASSSDAEGQTVIYSLGADSSGGGFKIDSNTGVVSVADPSKINFETAPGHSYTITVNSNDGFIASAQNFTIAVTDLAPSVPLDSNAAANAVTEGAAANTLVGVTASSTDVNGPAVTYSLTGDTSGGGFKINPATGVISVADGTRIDYETAPGHAYTVTVQSSDGTLTNSQIFTIAVNDSPLSAPVDTNAIANSVAEGAAAGTAVGVTALATDPNGPIATYSLTGDTSGGGFTINASTGVVTVADPSKIDYESAAGHAYNIIVQANDGLQTTSQTFTIAVSDVAPSTPVDSNAAANTVAEGAANGSTVSVTASSTDVNGPAVTYSLTSDTSGGGFTINAATGVVTVADSTKIDFESSGAGHSYTVTATASDGTLASSQTFTIGVTDVAPSTPVDSNAAANTVAEGAAAGSLVGVTASSSDVNGPAVTYSLSGDTSGGGFTIDAATGVVTVADPSKIDYETAAGHAYSITAQASDGTLTSSQTFTINVSDVAPSTPFDSDTAHANIIAEGAANGSTVGVTASSTDVNGPAVTYSLTGDTSGGGFTINATTGVVTVADSTKIDFEPSGGSYTVTAQASDGTLASSQTFTITVTDVAPSTPVDSNGAANQVAVSSPNGSLVGITAASSDVNGPNVTYSLTGDTSGGGFTINAATGVVSVADTSKILAADPSYDITVDASDGTLHSQQTFTINVVLDAPPVVTAGHTLNYTENQIATAIDPALTVTDSDNANLVSATVQITGGYVNGEDVLGFTNQNGISGSFNAATGTLTLTGSSSVANYQTALDSVTYFNTSENPSGAPRTVTFVTNDGTLDSAAVTDTINVTPVNDAPVVTAGHTLSYTENQAATAIDPAITVSDVDNANLASATVQITGNYANGQDILGFTNQNGITGSFNAATGTLTLSGSSSVANYQTALASVTYFNNSDNPSGLARTVTIIANDGAANSTSVTDTINVTPVNDAPVVTAGATLNYTENQAATAIASTLTVTDVDNTNLASATVQITGNYVNGQDILGFTNQNGITGSFNAATGTLTLSGSSSVANYQTALDSVTYFNNSDNPSGLDRTVTYIANDGTLNSNSGTATIHVTPVNDAPVVNATGTLAYTENQAAAAIAPALTLTDADSASLTSATVQITANYVNGEDVLAFTNTANITGSFNAATGTMTLTGTDTVANYQAALASVTYADSSENPSTLARTVTFTADDGQAANHQSAGSDHTINVTSVDDAPVNNGVPANFIVSSGFTHTVTGLSISDVDAGSANDITTTFTASAGTVTIGNGTSGGTAGIAGGATITTNGTGTVVLTGSITQINNTLGISNGVVYNAADNAGNTTATLQMATSDHGHTGTGGPITDTDTINIGVTPQVWFINQDQSAVDSTATRGSQANPFTDVHEFNQASLTATGPGANDYIYVKAGTYDGEGINLKAGQTLLGDDQALSFANPLGGPAIVIEDATGARPTIHVTTASDQGIALASGNTVAGIVVTTDATTVGIDDSGASVGTLNISDTDVTGAGQAINLTHGGTGGSVALGTVSSSGGTTGIALGGALATNFSATGGTLSGHTSSEITLNGGSGTVSYAGTIGDGTGLSASITNRTAGTVTLSGNINDGADSGGGIGISNNTGGTIDFTGTTKTLNTGTQDAVSMTNNSGATVDFTGGGLGITTTSGTAFSASVAGTYTVTGANNTISTTSGTALNLSHVTVGSNGINFASASTTSAGTGINIDTVSGGAVNVNGGSIAGATANGVNINAAQDNISIASSITSTAAGHSVQVTNSGSAGGNTISFSGAVTDPGLGINLDNNDQNAGGATVNFSGGLNIDSTTHTGFNATNGGTVNVTNGANNSITTTTGTAINVANTTIGSSNVTFHDISSNGGSADGIILDTTGSSGGLHVIGTGTTAGSGGTIANKAGADGSTTQGIGIYLNNTSDVQLANMQLNDFQNYGIFGNNVNGFTLAHSVINSTGGGWNGNQAGSGDASEASVAFDNLTGTASVSNTSISGGYTDNFRVTNSSGTLNRITFDTVNFGAVSSGAAVDGSQDQGHDGLLLESLNNAVLNATVQNSTFTSARGDLFNLTNNGTGADDLIFTNNHLSNNYVRIATGGGGFTLGSNGTGNTTYNIANNTFRDAVGTAVLIVESTTSNGVSMVGSFTGNSIGVAGVANSGSLEGDGLKAQFVGHLGAGGTGVFKTTIANNTIQEYNNFGVDLQTGGGAGASSGTYEAIVTGNTIGPIGSNTSAAQLQGIGFNGGNNPGDTFNSYLEIGGTGADANTVNNWTATNGLDDIRLRERQSTTLHLTAKNGAGTTDYSGAASDTAAIINFIEANNSTTGHVSVSVNANGVTGGAPPLYAAPGGVQASAPTPGETHLSQSELDSVVAAAIAQWATAGASADQLAALHATSFSVDDLAGDRLGEQTPGHITIDVDAAGHGWFVDPTPFDSFEFPHAQNVAGTDLLTDPSSAAAGHLDLLTTVTHELGHVLGLADTTDPSTAHDLMYINLVDGERRVPDAADVTEANSTLHSFQTIDNPIAAVTPPVVSSGQAAQPVVTDAGHGGGILFGGTGADNFQFAGVNVHASTPPPVTLVENYSVAQGDRFDFSAITSLFHDSGIGDALIVRAVEDASGKFATLQVDTIDPHGLPGQPNWVSVAQIDGAHAGDAVNVLIDGAAVHLTQLHVGLLA